MLTPDQIAQAAWREEILRLLDCLPGPARAAFDMIWPEGFTPDEAPMLLKAVQRAVIRYGVPDGPPNGPLERPPGGKFYEPGVGWHRA